MAQTKFGVPTRQATLLVAACLAIGAATSLYLGQDANWDLRNYHLANPHAVLNSRLDIDLDPSGIQSYFNPTLDLVYYALGRGMLSDHPRILAALVGLPYGAMILASLLIARRLVVGLSTAAATAVILATAAASVTGAGSLAQVGTAFNEVTIAMLVLFGFLLALSGPDPDRGGAKRHRSLLGSGVLMGLAAGLKLTAVIFAPAMVATLIATNRFRLWPSPGWALFSLAWVVGFAASAGWWAIVVYLKFGNPFFPLFNAWFHSPWYPPIDFRESRFLPKSILQWLFYPAWWATWTGKQVNAELFYSDPRLLLGLIAVIAAGIARLGAVFARSPTTRGTTFTTDQTFGLVFWSASYVLWLSGSAVMRYDIVLEVLGPLLFAALLLHMVAAVRPGNQWLSAGCAAAVSLACIAGTRAPDYGRVPYGTHVFDVDVSWVQAKTLFVAITGPTAYVPVFVPAEAKPTVVGLSLLMNPPSEHYPLTMKSAAMVRDHDGPIIVLVPSGDKTMLSYLPLLGLSPTLGSCRKVKANFDPEGVLACEGWRLPEQRSRATTNRE